MNRTRHQPPGTSHPPATERGLERIGLIAGSGRFPELFARAARARGFEVVALGHHGDTDPSLAQSVDALHWVHLGQLGRSVKLLRAAGVRRAVMAGGIGKLGAVLRARLDLRGAAVVARLRHFNDDHVLRAVAEEYERGGIRIEPSTLLTPELLAPAGVLGRRRPSASEERDLRFGFEVARAIGRADVGQTVVVEDGKVLAVEASEGTDATILRGGGYGRGHAVVVKCAKPGQDLRFDLPAAGEKTIEAMARHGCKVLGLEAGRALLLDGEALLRRADDEGIAVVGVEP